MADLASRMDRRVRLERATTGRDEYGGPVQTWTPLASVWAEVSQKDGYERNSADMEQARGEATFVIRWQRALADLNPKDRLIWDGKVYDIQSVKELGRRVGLRIVGRARDDEVA